MEEPTQWEIIRDIQADVRLLVESRNQYVSREIYERDQKDTDRRLTAMETGKQDLKRWVTTAVLAPLLVGVVLYFLLGGKP